MATTIKLPPELKERVASIARSTGKSPHAFMLEAIAARTEQEERRREFLAEAVEARAESDETGKAYDAPDVHAFLKARVRGKKTARPKATKWRG